MNFQPRPPSSDRYTPSPQYVLCRLLASPVPSQTTFGFPRATATAPIVIMALTWSNTGVHEVPPLVLLNKPPVALATYSASGAPASRPTAKSSIRPPVLAGPTLRHSNDEIRDGSSRGCARAAAPSPRLATAVNTTASSHTDIEGITYLRQRIRTVYEARRRNVSAVEGCR